MRYLQSDLKNITINQDLYRRNIGERVITNRLSLEEILKNRIQAEKNDLRWNVLMKSKDIGKYTSKFKQMLIVLKNKLSIKLCMTTY